MKRWIKLQILESKIELIKMIIFYVELIRVIQQYPYITLLGILIDLENTLEILEVRYQRNFGKKLIRRK